MDPPRPRPGEAYLLELKCAHLSPTYYAPKPWRLQEEAQGKSCLVVEKRARRETPSTSGKAQRTDQTYCGTAPGTVGPVVARLRTLGQNRPARVRRVRRGSSAVIEK